MIRYKPLIDNTDTAFLGTVPASELFTGQEISEQLGLTAGTPQNNNTDWLHFYVGKDAICNRDPNKRPYYIWIAKRTIRYSLSWDDINAVGVITGKLVTDKNGKEYLCRIPTGADKNPSTYSSIGNTCDMEAGLGSEWNSLMYRVSEKVPTCSNDAIGIEFKVRYGNPYHGGSQVGDNWADYTYQELSMNLDVGGNGTATWCVEMDGKNSCYRVNRGYLGVASFTTSLSNDGIIYHGFRPVLIRYL